MSQTAATGGHALVATFDQDHGEREILLLHATDTSPAAADFML